MTSSQGLLICVSWLVIGSYYTSAVEVSMEGTGYIAYDLRSDSIAKDTNTILFSFKTFRPSGLFLHSSGSQGDFITIELIHGQIRFTIDLGSTKTTSVILGNKLSDNKWHEVKIDRNKRTVDLTVDKVKSQATVPGSNVRLDLDTFMYVGGLDKSVSGYHGVLNAPNFNGCMKNLYFDNKDIFYGAHDIHHSDFKTYGPLRFNCSSTEYIPVNFPSPDTHLKLRKNSPKNFTVNLSFRTYDGNGVLVYKESRNALLYVLLSSGNLELEILVGSDSRRPIKISSVGEELNDGMWHDVTAGVTSKELWFQLDSKPEVRHENPGLSDIGDFKNRFYIGNGSQKTGFVGCMRQIKLNGSPVDLKSLRDSQKIGVVINDCSISSKCFPNPCKNQGLCLQTWKAFTCDCKTTFYDGARCEIPLYRATCHEYKGLGMTQDAYCKVDADGSGPLGAFTVLCNMTASDAAKTVIKHNKEGKQKVTSGAKSFPGLYLQRITYKNNMDNVHALIQRSSHCRQFISFRCYNSKLLNSPIGPKHVQWKSSTNVLQNNWGGAPSGSGKCACGVNRTCEDPSKYCNCDAEDDDKWREDYGYLTDKSLLPVTMLQFSADAVDSFFMLGPLECFGSSGHTSDHVTNANFVSSVCKLVNPPPTADPTPEATPDPTTTSYRLTTTQGTVTKPRKTSTITVTSPTGKPKNTVHSKHHVTLTTTIATHKNSTLVTSVLSHDAKNDGVTVHSSITTGRSGVTVHSSITTKGKTVTLPPVTTVEPRSPRVLVITNGSISYITHVKGGIVYDARFIILVTSSVLAFILLIWVIIFVFLKRSGRSYVCCISCKSCKRRKNIPDIEVYRHSLRTDSPDEVMLDDINHGEVEVGTYKITNGQTVYHSVHRNSHVRKYVSFSASTSQL